MLYVSYYPEKLIITSEILNNNSIITNAVIFHNPNSYNVKNIRIKMSGLTSQITESREYKISDGYKPNVFDHLDFEYDTFIKEIHSKGYKHINPYFGNIGDAIVLKDFSIDIVYSLETLFIYPDIKSELISFSGYLKPNGDIIYIYN